MVPGIHYAQCFSAPTYYIKNGRSPCVAKFNEYVILKTWPHPFLKLVYCIYRRGEAERTLLRIMAMNRSLLWGEISVKITQWCSPVARKSQGISLSLASSPGPTREERAWYPLLVHARNFQRGSSATTSRPN